MRPWFSRIPKPAVFAYLMLLSVVLLLVPPSWKAWMRGLVQPVGWIEGLVSAGARDLRDGADRVLHRQAVEQDPAQLREEIEELRRQIAAQSLRLDELSRIVDDLTGIRAQLRGSGRIVFGSVLGGSPTPRRETLTIWPGSLHGIKSGDWVAAGVPEEHRDADLTGRELLMRQWLIGRISDVQPYRSTVRLLTDPESAPLRVVAARRLADGRWQRSDREGLLHGVGRGAMQVRNAVADWHAEGYTLVLAALPGPSSVAICVGRITGASRLPDAALWYNIAVEPPADARRLDTVYVLSFDP